MADLTDTKHSITLEIIPFTAEHGGDVINLSYHHNGRLEADRLQIADRVREYDVVILKFPDQLIAVSPTYCRGLLEDAFNIIGNLDDLRSRIIIDGSPYVKRWLEIGFRNLKRKLPD